METTPDKYFTVQVNRDEMDERLNEIHQHGSTVISVCNNHVPGTFLITYYNPPLTVTPGIGGSGDSATMQ